jgi:hypothetical protein
MEILKKTSGNSWNAHAVLLIFCHGIVIEISPDPCTILTKGLDQWSSSESHQAFTKQIMTESNKDHNNNNNNKVMNTITIRQYVSISTDKHVMSEFLKKQKQKHRKT